MMATATAGLAAPLTLAGLFEEARENASQRTLASGAVHRTEQPWLLVNVRRKNYLAGGEANPPTCRQGHVISYLSAATKDRLAEAGARNTRLETDGHDRRLAVEYNGYAGLFNKCKTGVRGAFVAPSGWVYASNKAFESGGTGLGGSARPAGDKEYESYGDFVLGVRVGEVTHESPEAVAEGADMTERRKRRG